jgi:hypothetical protein
MWDIEIHSLLETQTMERNVWERKHDKATAVTGRGGP